MAKTDSVRTINDVPELLKAGVSREEIRKMFNAPNCLNPGCKRKAKWTHGSRYSPFCGTCEGLYSKGKPFPAHITPVKRFRCENENGKLEFPCVVDWKLVDIHKIRISTHIDHIDGNHYNNTLNNTQELCPICHDRKSKMNGDYGKQVNQFPRDRSKGNLIHLFVDNHD